jgi:hypothetical protein
MIVILFWQNTDFSQLNDIDFHNFNLKDSINCFCQVHDRILRKRLFKRSKNGKMREKIAIIFSLMYKPI